MTNSKKRILVVDDEVYLQTSISLWLKTDNYEVHTAGNGKVAFEKILSDSSRNLSFNLLVLDIQMPIMNGLELMDKLNHLHISIPILVVTGYGDSTLLKELLKRNCNEYLDKPFSEDILLSKVKSILNRQKQCT